ncbi:MAG: GNAT superfamily N-acetyltransferase [Flavobacteriales bacterium]|jgi:GNAT superfamily N-acetyltransferase
MDSKDKIPLVKIIAYESGFKQDFYRLNIEWLAKFFEVEPYDEQVLSKPEEYILKDGGAIYFAKLNEEIIGTVALLKRGNGVFELTKMGVTPAYQGLKIGQKLMYAAIHEASQMGATRVFLDSNRILEPAITLYHKVGFKEIPVPADSPYKRCNIRMELWV